MHHIDTGSAAPMFARPQWLDPDKHCIAEEEFLAMEKAAPTRIGRPCCTWYTRKTALGAPAATTATLTPSSYPTGTPSLTCSP
jgi:hypothetical protein